MEKYASQAIAFGFALGSLGLAGCASEDRPPPVERGPGVSLPSPGTSVTGRAPADVDPSADLDVDRFPIDGHLAGRLGTIALDATPYRMDSSISRGNAHIALYAEGVGGEGMIAFDIRGGLEHEDLARGLPLTFGGIEPSDPAALFVNAIGCSGLRAGDWDYDAPASEITIRVRPSVSAEQLEVEIDADFGAGYADSSNVHAFVTIGR